MAADDIGVGGDSSVRWNIDCRNFRTGTDKSEGKDGGWHQEGIAETDEGKDFAITIKLPASARKNGKERARFLKALAASVKSPKNNNVVIKIPIEPGNMTRKGKVDQIKISWPNRRKRRQA